MGSICIHLIDDHALFRAGMRFVLQAGIPDIEVREAASLEEAVRGNSEPPTIVLLDIRLQGVNGIEGLALLKKRWPQAPVIMLTSAMEPDIVRLALYRGAAAFVSKAETVEKILQVIHQTLSNILSHTTNDELRSTYSDQIDKPRFTPRQCEVMSLLCEGLSNKVIARRMALSEFTVRSHVQAIFFLLQVRSRSEAIFTARRDGLIG